VSSLDYIFFCDYLRERNSAHELRRFARISSKLCFLLCVLSVFPQRTLRLTSIFQNRQEFIKGIFSSVFHLWLFFFCDHQRNLRERNSAHELRRFARISSKLCFLLCVLSVFPQRTLRLTSIFQNHQEYAKGIFSSVFHLWLYFFLRLSAYSAGGKFCLRIAQIYTKSTNEILFFSDLFCTFSSLSWRLNTSHLFYTKI